MKTTIKLFMVVLFLSMGLYAQTGKGPLSTGNALLEAWQAYEKLTDNLRDSNITYNAGMFVGYVTAINHETIIFGVCTFPEGVSFSQVFRVVGKYLEDHPEKLHLTPYELVLHALMTAFPKKNESMAHEQKK